MALCLRIFLVPLILFLFSIEIIQSDDALSENVRIKRSESFVVKLPAVRHDVVKKSRKSKNLIVVQTAEGKVRGYHRELNGYKCYSFYGIPYGTIPARFLAAKPAKPWKGILDGTKASLPCIQKDKRTGLVGGVEDCLNLEVHTMNVTGKRPVIFWVHGGSFNYGTTGQFEMIRLTNENVVVVSISYRLGVFGFLSTGTKNAPGNVGLKDAVLALRWVQKNIHNFGGDPNNVCLYGCSSGGSMVMYLTLNPHAKGLFSSVFSQSGLMTPEYSFNKYIEERTLQLARLLGVNSLDWDIIIDKLRRMNASDLLIASENLLVDPLPRLAFTPSLEKIIEGEEWAIAEYPKTLLKNGNYIDVPVMISFTDKEGLAVFDENLNVNELYKALTTNIKWFLPLQYVPNMLSQKDVLEIYDSFNEYYFKGQRPSTNTLLQVIYFLGDVGYYYMFQHELELRNQTTKKPIYLFNFAFDSEFNSFHKAIVNISGVGHAEDLGYYVDIPGATVNAKTPPTVKLVSARVVKMLANFAEFKNPTPTKTKLLPVKFLPYQSSPEGCYLKVTDKLEMMYGNPHLDSYNFAKEIFAKMQEEVDP